MMVGLWGGGEKGGVGRGGEREGGKGKGRGRRGKGRGDEEMRRMGEGMGLKKGDGGERIRWR